jgi:hypothetical protein
LIYDAFNGLLEKTSHTIDKADDSSALPIGSRGEINSIPYLVIGHVKKKENGTVYFWDEYTLFNPIHGPAYLSCYEGHWIYLKELNYYPVVSARIATHDLTYELYSKYKSKIVTASGEFLYQFTEGEIAAVEEYIRPPFMITKEKSDTNITWYKGEHISPEEIRSKFKLPSIPERKGVGMIQPFVGKFKPGSLNDILFLILVIWGAFQLYFYNTAKEEAAFSQNFQISDSTEKKEIMSYPFDLKYGTKNAEVKISTTIDNSWLYTNVTLVNEATGDIYDTDLEAEYYHGYEDGSAWSEGKNWISKVISQVPEGKYYLVIYSEKPVEYRYVNINISVTRDVFVFSNGLIALALIAIFPIFYYYRRNSFEQRRWYNSNYSPYDN